MIIGIGIDLVEIARFSTWHQKSKQQLLRIFSEEEIDYCLENPRKSAERFAARFAAREAFYKAAFPLFKHKISFLRICSLVRVCSPAPLIKIRWEHLPIRLPYRNIRTHISISHSSSSSSVVVILEYDERQDTPVKKAYQVDNLPKSVNL